MEVLRGVCPYLSIRRQETGLTMLSARFLIVYDINSGDNSSKNSRIARANNNNNNNN